jgi:microcystin-dependent protein
MSAPLIGQIAIFAFNFEPVGWAFCHGQLLPIAQNVPLFSVLSTTYGGNGQSTFALPHLQGIPVGAGQGPGLSDYPLGQAGGEANVALTPQQMPSHSHAFNAVTNQATSASPQGNQLAKAWKAQAKTDSVVSFYSDNPGNAKTALAPNAIGVSGSGHPHNNMQPCLTLNFCIALAGVVPSPDGAPAPVRQPFLGEISICAFGNPPPGWALCEGQMLPIISNNALFSLIFTAYGGDGERHFALPDLRGRVPLNLEPGPDSSLGQMGGQETHALTVAEMPAHSHALMADATSTSVGNTPSPETVPGMSLGKVVPGNTPFTTDLYSTAAAGATLAGASLGNSGGGQPHSNIMPSLALSFCISLSGPYPGR